MGWMKTIQQYPLGMNTALSFRPLSKYAHLNPFLEQTHTHSYTHLSEFDLQRYAVGWYVNCWGQRAQSVLLYLGLMTCRTADGLMI